MESSSRFVWSAMYRMPSMARYSSGQWCQWFRVWHKASTLSSDGRFLAAVAAAEAEAAPGEPWILHWLPRLTASNSLRDLKKIEFLVRSWRMIFTISTNLQQFFRSFTEVKQINPTVLLYFKFAWFVWIQNFENTCERSVIEKWKHWQNYQKSFINKSTKKSFLFINILKVRWRFFVKIFDKYAILKPTTTLHQYNHNNSFFLIFFFCYYMNLGSSRSRLGNRTEDSRSSDSG